MPVPIRARCRRCRNDLYLRELIQRRRGTCPRCEWALSPDYPDVLVDESRRAERSLSELVRALRRLVGLPGNLDLQPHSLFESLFEEVGWERDLVAHPDLLAVEVESLRKQADRWARLTSDPEESASLSHGLRSLAKRFHRLGDALDGEATSGELSSLVAKDAAARLDDTADSITAGKARRSDVEDTIQRAERVSSMSARREGTVEMLRTTTHEQ